MAGTPTGVSGARVSDDLTSAEIVRDVSPAVLMLQDDKKSFMTYLSSLRTEAAADVKFEWFEDEITPKTGTTGNTIASAASGSTANIDLSGLTNTVYLTVDDQIKFPSTGQIVRVNTVPSFASAVNVTLGVNGVEGAIGSGAQWTKIGDARDELSRLYDGDTLHSVSVQPASAYNYTQTFRTAVGASRREKKRKLYTAQGSNDYARQKVKALLEHCEKQEHAFLHGARTDTGATNTGRTTTGGAISFISSGNTEAITTLTEAEFEDFVRRITRYGATGKRTLFCSRYVASLISAWGRDRQRITNPGRTVKHGVEIDKYLAGCGTTVEIVPTHALEGRPGHTTRGVWDGYALLLDMEGKAKKVFGGDNMVWADGLQPNDADGTTGAYLSDVGYLPGDARKDGLITGVTA